MKLTVPAVTISPSASMRVMSTIGVTKFLRAMLLRLLGLLILLLVLLLPLLLLLSLTSIPSSSSMSAGSTTWIIAASTFSPKSTNSNCVWLALLVPLVSFRGGAVKTFFFPRSILIMATMRFPSVMTWSPSSLIFCTRVLRSEEVNDFTLLSLSIVLPANCLSASLNSCLLLTLTSCFTLTKSFGSPPLHFVSNARLGYAIAQKAHCLSNWLSLIPRQVMLSNPPHPPFSTLPIAVMMVTMSLESQLCLPAVSAHSASVTLDPPLCKQALQPDSICLNN
mmetsp:Transcript_91673/g.158984  ORF Transcript_91673/g.158984 Transcript_91673/m.158984 type:complete len:279 (+) Transcript_91673:366-1202(+)